MIRVEKTSHFMDYFYKYSYVSGYLILKGENLPESLSFDYYIRRICTPYCHWSNVAGCNRVSMLGLDN